jgi:hypothetical protein
MNKTLGKWDILIVNNVRLISIITLEISKNLFFEFSDLKLISFGYITFRSKISMDKNIGKARYPKVI